MSIETRSFIGLTMFVADELPATNDSAGFEALTWIPVKGLVTGPALGVTHSAVEIPDLQTGFGLAVKGMGQGIESSLVCRAIANDPGQAKLKELAEAGRGEASIKVGWGSAAGQALDDGDPVKYAQGFLHSYRENAATGDSYEGFEVTFRQNAAHVNAVEPA